MGYYSDVTIAVTKKGYEKIRKDQKKLKESYLDEFFTAEEYEKNGIKCVLMRTEDTIKYYDSFEDIAQLEKTLSKLKDGYAFARFGEERGDIEFRNNTKLKELLEPFEFVKYIYNNLKKEYEKEEEDEFE